MRPSGSNKNTCRMCNVRVAVGVQCAACDFWYHATEKCAGDGRHGRPPFICDSCSAQLHVPAIQHFASGQGLGDQTHRASMLLGSPRRRRKKMAEIHSPDASFSGGGSPVRRRDLIGSVRGLRRMSMLLSSQSLKTPPPVPHVSGAEVLFNDESSSSSSASTPSSNDGRPQQEEAVTAGGGDASTMDRAQQAAGEHTYHSTYAPMLHPRSKGRVRRSVGSAVLQLIAPEKPQDGTAPGTSEGGAGVRWGVPGDEGGDGGNDADLVGGKGLAGAFEENRFDITAALKKGFAKLDGNGCGGDQVDVAGIMLVEEFNSNAFGHRQGERDNKDAQNRKAMLLHKIREKKAALKKRAAALVAMRSGGAAATDERIAARSTQQVVLAHRKLYYADVPPPISAPWLHADASSDSGSAPVEGDGTHQLRRTFSLGKLANTVKSARGEDDARALLSRTTNGLRISTVEEVAGHGFKESSEDEDEIDAAAIRIQAKKVGGEASESQDESLARGITFAEVDSFFNRKEPF